MERVLYGTATCRFDNRIPLYDKTELLLYEETVFSQFADLSICEILKSFTPFATETQALSERGDQGFVPTQIHRQFGCVCKPRK
jgi:hypothetical protein